MMGCPAAADQPTSLPKPLPLSGFDSPPLSGLDSPAPPVPPPVADLVTLAAEVGLVLRGTLPAEPLDCEVGSRLTSWLAEGRAGEMLYLERGAPYFADLRAWKSWARGALLFALPYHRPGGGFRGGGRVARYALGRDYHNVLGRRLQKLGRRLVAAGVAARFRAVVDAAPVLEREWAIRGCVGFRGKNTLLLHPEHGPWVLLGELLVDREVPAWSPPPARRASCGSCTRCLDACPTGAFDAAYRLDPRRCLSYLTIESKGWMPRELRRAAGEWVFGCDVCLEVCPFGAKDVDHADAWGLHPALNQLTLDQLLTLSEPVFHKLFTGSPLRRAGREGLVRNACIALGNLGQGEQALRTAVEGDASAIVRGHAVWALGVQDAARGVRARLALHDPDPQVRLEAENTLK